MMSTQLLPPRRALGWLRFIVWIMPTFLSFPVFLVLLGLFHYMAPSLAWVAVLVVVALFCLAKYDALLSCQQRRMVKDDPKAKIGRNAFVYILLQL